MEEDSLELPDFLSHEKSETQNSIDTLNKREIKSMYKFKEELLEKEKIDARMIREEYSKPEDLFREIHENPPDKVGYFDLYEKYGLIPLIAIKKDGTIKKVVFGLRYTKKDSDEVRDVKGFSICLEQEVYSRDELGKNVDREYLILTRKEFDKLKKYTQDKDAFAKREKLLDIIKIDKESRITYEDILRVAIKHGASDIHIEPLSDEESRIRLRIDGVLRGLESILEEKRKQLVQIIKGDAKMDISEKRRPQAGSIIIEHEGQKYNLRVSTINTNHGEKVVLRILKSQEAAFNLEKLGYPTKIYRDIKDLIYSPSGIILITGPTGSGKTTTLYSILQERNTEGINIITIEDPIEIDLAGINQTQINDNIGYTFANALRSFLRQDPDIILIGEMRDKETAQMAAHAAKTGPLVFSTLHARDSIETLLRLHDFEVDKRDLAACLKGVISQRLARKLCEKCREKYSGRTEINDMFKEEVIKEKVAFFKKPDDKDGKACSYCDGIGYKGRIVVPELWLIGDEEREMIEAGNTNHGEYFKVALNKGMWDLMYGAMRLVITGKTSLDEIFRVAVSKHDFLNRKDYIAKIIPEIIKELKNKPGDTTLP